MESGNVITVLIGLAGIAGGFLGGRRLAGGQAISTALEVVDLLQAQITMLKEDRQTKTTQIAALEIKVEVLEDLVTQRADVLAVKEVVDRIAIKMGA